MCPNGRSKSIRRARWDFEWRKNRHFCKRFGRTVARLQGANDENNAETYKSSEQAMHTEFLFTQDAEVATWTIAQLVDQVAAVETRGY